MINICFVVCILLFAPYVYIKLPLGSFILGNGMLASYIFRSYDKKFQKSTINICFVAWILVFAPYVYIELPVKSSRRELQILAMGFGLHTHSGAMSKLSEVSDQYLLYCKQFSMWSLCIYWTPYRELQILAIGFGHLTHSGAMPKNFRSLRSIFALLLAF